MRMLSLVIGVTLMIPLAGFAAPRTFSEFVEMIVGLMNYTIGTIVVLALVIYFAGAVKHLLDVQRGEHSGIGNFLAVGIGILFVMVSVWGILALLQNTFFPDGGTGGGGTSETLRNCGFEGNCDI